MEASAVPKVLKVATSGEDGAYRTVQEAIDAVAEPNKSRTEIHISPGVYEQPIYIPRSKDFITLRGLAPESEKTVITYHNTHAKIEHHQNCFKEKGGTFSSGTLIIDGEDFIAENITFENSAPKGSGPAVGLRVSADRCAFYNCRFLGWQDTLYLHKGKQYLRDCYIEGSVDFICGNSTAFFEQCRIFCKLDSEVYITAQKRDESDVTTGFVFLRCTIMGETNEKTQYAHLGRPWANLARVVFAHTEMDQCVHPQGWHEWANTENHKTSCFYEYKCTGPGYCPSERVSWCKEITDEEVGQFITHSFVDCDPQKPWLSQRVCSA